MASRLARTNPVTVSDLPDGARAEAAPTGRVSSTGGNHRRCAVLHGIGGSALLVADGYADLDPDSGPDTAHMRTPSSVCR